MRADRERSLAARDRGKRIATLLDGQTPRQPCHPHRQAVEPRGKLSVMLLSENLGRRHERYLIAGLDGLKRSERRHHGLAATHVTLQQALHGLRPREVTPDFCDDALLRAGQQER